MASIVSTSRPYGLDNNSSSINTGSNISNNTPTGSVATNGLTNTLSSKKEKSSYKIPGINNLTTPGVRQQAVVTGTEHNYQPTVKYENRYLNNVTGQKVVNNSNLSNADRSNLNILNNWASKLKASNNANNVTTYMNDPSTVPLTRRDTLGFFDVVYNPSGTYTLGTTGVKVGDEVYGKWTLVENMSWNPIKAYSVAAPMGQYLMNFNSYDTKNKIVQGTMAFAHSYSNLHDGTKNFVDDYAIKEWGNLVDMSINWKDRNAMENTVAGLNTVTGLSQRYGLNKYLGGDAVVGGIQDVLALYTFGNSVYQLGNNWSKMSVSERAAGMFNTIGSGFQAYGALKPYYGKLVESVTSQGVTSTAQNAAVNTGIQQGVNTAARQGVQAAAAQQGVQQGVRAAAQQGVSQPVIANATRVGASGGYQGGILQGSGEYIGVTEGPGLYQGAQVEPYKGSINAENAANSATGAFANFSLAKARGKSDRTAAGWGIAGGIGGWAGGPVGAGIVAGAQAIEQFCENGRSTAKDRQGGAISGAATGAMIGSAAGPIGAAIGALVGTVVGVAANSGKFGHSREQYHRGIYREALGQTGIFEKAAKGTPHHGHFYYQLADGQYYNVGIDGSGGRASDINGKIKTVYDQNQILDRDWHNSEKVNHEIRPYDVDYTCNMDYTGSLMLAPLNALGLGGSNIEDAAEYNQMLGYMTNACTSNVGRDMTRENFNKMISNIQAGYERVGINNRQDAQNALALSYMQGNITDEDWDSFQLALNLLYSDNGYDQAMSLMDQLGRDTSQKSVEEIGSAQPSGEESGSAQPSGEEIDPGFNGNNRPAPTDEAVRPGEELTPVSGKADVSEMYVQQDLNPADIPADTSTARPERATQEDLMNETNPAKDAAREQFIQEHGTGE